MAKHFDSLQKLRLKPKHTIKAESALNASKFAK